MDASLKYYASLARFLRHSGVRTVEDLSDRQRMEAVKFENTVGVLNWFAQRLNSYTKWTDADARDALEDVMFDFMYLTEITIVSGWVYKLVRFCVRRRWWRTLECAVEIFDLRRTGVVLDPDIARLLDDARAHGFEPSPEW